MKLFNRLKLNQRGFGHIELVLVIAVVVAIGGVGSYVWAKHNTSHAGSQVIANIDTQHNGSFLIIGCKQKISATQTNIQTTANYADPIHVKYGTLASVSSYFVKDPNSPTIFAGSKDSTNGGTWANGTTASLTFSVDQTKYSSIRFGISTTNGYIKLSNEINKQDVALSDIPKCNLAKPVTPVTPVTKKTGDNNTQTSTKPTTSNGTSTGLTVGTKPTTATDNNTVSKTGTTPTTTVTDTSGKPVTIDTSGTTSLYLLAGQKLNAHDKLISPKNKYLLVMQSAGDLVEINTKNNKVIWKSATGKRPDGGVYAILQKNGNFEIKDSKGKVLWTKDTQGHKGDVLSLDNAGNIVLSSKTGKILWTTKPPAPKPVPSAPPVSSHLTASGQTFRANTTVLASDSKAYTFVMQDDGNLVEYYNGAAAWSTQTNGNPGSSVVFQTDGNLVVYNAGGGSIWQSGTGGNPGATLNIDNSNGRITVNSTSGNVLWPQVPPQPFVPPGSPGGDPITGNCLFWYTTLSIKAGGIFHPSKIWKAGGIGNVTAAVCSQQYSKQPLVAWNIWVKDHYQWAGFNSN